MAEIPQTQIVTLTINPALDVSTSVTKMVPFTKMRCAQAHRDPGGGGINVARVLKRLGLEATAIYPAGGATGQLLATLVEREGVRSIVIPTSNDTREDITIFDETTREQFRLVFPGARLNDIEWQECLGSIARITPQPAFIIASGSVPAGVPHDFFGRVAQASKAHSKIIVDTSGPFLKAALEAGVYLIKPNLREFQELAEHCRHRRSHAHRRRTPSHRPLSHRGHCSLNGVGWRPSRNARYGFACERSAYRPHQRFRRRRQLSGRDGMEPCEG